MPNADPLIIANPERLAGLQRLCLLDSPTDPAFDRLTRLATHILNVPISTVTLVDDHRQFFKSQIGVGEPWASKREMPLDYSYCQHVVATQRPLIVEDSRVHPLLRDNRSTLEEGLVAYAGIPLVTSDGDALGTFCVIDKKPRVWTEEEIQILEDLSAAVMTEIELRAELTRREAAEAALVKSQQQLQGVISNAPLIIYAVDLEGIITMIDGKGQELLTLPLSRNLGKSVFEVNAGRPDLIANIHNALVGTSSLLTIQTQGKAGTVYFECSMTPLYEADGSISGALAVLTDVTGRELAEQQLESSFQRLTLVRRIEVELGETLELDSVLSIAMDTALRASRAEHGFIGLIEGEGLRIVHAVGNYHKGSFWDIPTGVIGRSLRLHEAQLVLDTQSDPDFIHDIPNIREQMAIPLIHRDRLIGVLNLKTSKPGLFTPDAFEFLRLLAGQITIAIDNSQLYAVSQKQIDELHQLYMRVSELEQLKTDMIRIAAHDLRNPLGLINGYAQLMLLEGGDPLTDEQREFLEAIEGGGNRMLKIINDILSLQRIEASQNKGQSEETNLSELLEDIFHSNVPRAQQKMQTYQLHMPPISVIICVDAAQVREAMDNLISNAIKYTPANGSVTVQLQTSEYQVVFEVIDNGYGIPADQQGRLFQPFFRASNAKESNIEGTGLGLHLVKNIIERQGGQMRFQSELGKGSTFGFELPLG